MLKCGLTTCDYNRFNWCYPQKVDNLTTELIVQIEPD